MAERQRACVIFTGGTIAMLPDPDTGAAIPTLDGAAILARVPGLESIAELEALDWDWSRPHTCASASCSKNRRPIRQAGERADVQGIVVVQGTDVLEETAFAWTCSTQQDNRRGGRGRHAQCR